VVRPGTRQIETPYLQLALTRLWWREREQDSRVLRGQSLSDLDGATGIARSHFMETMGGLEDEERRLCAVIFERIVTPSGMKIALSADDLAKMLKEDPARVEAVLDKLDSGASRIIHRVQPPQGAPARFEIFHDVLSRPILEWVATERERMAHERELDQERRKAEADRQKADLEHQRQQEELAKQQIQLAREKQLKRRSYRIAVVASFACLLALVTAGWAIAKHHEARAQRGRTLATQAEHLLAAGDRRTALLLALEALPRGRSALESARNWLNWPDKDYAFHVLDRTLTAPLGRDLQVGQDRITFVGFDKKGTMVTASTSGGIDVWPPEAVDQLTAWADMAAVPHTHLQHERPADLSSDASIAITSVAFDRSDRMVTADRSGFVYLWAIGEKRLLARWAVADRTRIFASISPDGAFIATASFDDRNPHLWAVKGTGTGVDVKPVRIAWNASHDKPITSISFDAEGKRLVTASLDGTAAIWNIADGRQLQRVNHDTGGFFSARLSPDGRRLVTGGGWGVTTARVWELNPQAAAAPLILKHDKPISALDFDTTGRQIVTGSQDGGVRIWNAETGALLVRVQGPAQAGNKLVAALSPDGRKLVANFGEDRTYIWQLYGQAQMPRIAKLPEGVVAISTDRAATRVAVASQTNVELFGSQGQLLRSLDFAVPPLAVAMSPDGGYLAVAAGRAVRLLSTDRTDRDIVLPETRSLILSLAFDPAGKRLAIATQDGSLHLSTMSDAGLGDALVLAPHDPITALVFTGDGRQVYAGSTQGRIHLVDADAWRELPDPGLSLRDRAILTLDFAPGGRHLVASAADLVAAPQDLVGGTAAQTSPFLKAPVILDVAPSQTPGSEMSLRRYLDALQATNVLALGPSKENDNGSDLRQWDERGDRVIVIPVDKMFHPGQGLPLPEDTYGRISYASEQVRRLPEKYRALTEQERCAYGLELKKCGKQAGGLR
ncbi:MAG: hypothetical protein U1E38_06775, partial [Rhodospirillales bacterium]